MGHSRTLHVWHYSLISMEKSYAALAENQQLTFDVEPGRNGKVAAVSLKVL